MSDEEIDPIPLGDPTCIPISRFENVPDAGIDITSLTDDVVIDLNLFTKRGGELRAARFTFGYFAARIDFSTLKLRFDPVPLTDPVLMSSLEEGDTGVGFPVSVRVSAIRSYSPGILVAVPACDGNIGIPGIIPILG